MSVFIFTYNQSQMSHLVKQLEVLISASKYINEWSSPFPGTYFLKSHADISVLRSNFSDFLDGAYFVIAEINSSHLKTEGYLSKAVWTWLQASETTSLSALLPNFENKN